MDIKDVEKAGRIGQDWFKWGRKTELLSDMESILGYVKQIESVEVPDMDIEYSNRNIWREDIARQDLASSEFSYEEIIKQFPDSQEWFCKSEKDLW